MSKPTEVWIDGIKYVPAPAMVESKTIGELITDFRMEKDLSVTELAKMLEITPMRIYQIESNRSMDPRCSTLRKLYALGISAEALLTSKEIVNE